MYEIILQWGVTGPLLLVIAGLAILIIGGESLIRGASRLAVAMKIPPLIIGLTIVACCTSAPELAISLSAAFKGNADMAIGNVVGSNICNICLILGLAALLQPIRVESTLIRREIPMVILLSIIVYVFAVLGGDAPLSILFSGQFTGQMLPWQGGLLMAILCGYIAWTVYEVLVHKKANAEYAKEVEQEVLPDSIAESQGWLKGWRAFAVNVGLLILGIAMLVFGSDMMVLGSVKLAKMFGVSELIIGLTILAVGTSLPELVVSVLAAAQGKSEIAVGNVIGSNAFNILGVLGPTAFITGFTQAGGLQVSPRVLLFDIPIMILASFFCIVICITDRKVSRKEGVFLLLSYAAYLVFLCVMD